MITRPNVVKYEDVHFLLDAAPWYIFKCEKMSNTFYSKVISVTCANSGPQGVQKGQFTAVLIKLRLSLKNTSMYRTLIMI